MKCWLWSSCAFGISALLPGAAAAQQTPAASSADQSAANGPGTKDDIIVTATKSGAQRLEKVPLAVTAFNEEAVRARGALALADLASFTPGFTYSYNGIYAIASIRGIGTNNVFAGGDPSTTLQVDGVYYGRPTGANLDFLDIERVEVLRGPQGTLYGRNAIGGTVNVITRDPTNTVQGEVRLTGGTYGLVRPEFSISGPLDDKVAVSLAGVYSRRDGYIHQLNPGQPDGWDENREAIRGKVKIRPGSDVNIVLSADYTHSDENFAGFTVRASPLLVPDGFQPGFFQAATDTRNGGVLRQWGVSGRLTWRIGNTTFTSISAYRNSFTDFQGDLDFSAVPLFSTRTFAEHQNQISQEFDLSGGLGTASYVIGLFGYREKARSAFDAVVFGNLLTQGIDATTKSGAIFGQVDYPVTAKVKFTLGLRYTIDRKNAENIYGAQRGGITDDVNQQAAGTQPIFAGKDTRHAATPKFGVEFQATDDLLAYVSVTRGFKSGGYNLLIDPTTIGAAQYGPEHVWAYEGGLKINVPSGHGHLNIAGFYYDYTGLQVNQFVFLPNSVAQVVNNAKAARLIGAEIEGAIHPANAVELGGNFAYLDATYRGAFPAIDNFTNTVVNPDGKRLNDAPRWSGSGYAELTYPVGAIVAHLRGDAIYKSTVFYTPLNDLRLGSAAHWLFDASLTFALPPSGLQVGARVDNIGNRKYVTSAYYAFSAGNQPGAPRTVRAFIGYRF